MALTDDLLRRLMESLAGDPAYKPYGPPDITPWGCAQWVEYTDPEGVEHFMRVTVEPPPD